MGHSDILKWFGLYFPDYVKHIQTWFPNGKNSIRIRQDNKQEFIFTFNTNIDWCFETVDNFLKRSNKK